VFSGYGLNICKRKGVIKMSERMKLKEEDLYQPVRSYFENLGYAVNGEVLHCDVTAVKDDVLVIVEMKTSLNLDVILQAVQRQKFADFSYIAVPKNSKIMHKKRWLNICHLLKRLELGLLLVTVQKKGSSVEEAIQPLPFDRAKSISSYKRKRKAMIHEIQERHGDYNTGGSTRKKLVTSYRETAIQIAVILKEHGPCAIKKIREAGKLPEKTGNILRDNHYGWFERESHGVYKLTEKALAELEKYPELTGYYSSKLIDLRDEKQ
jgi:hypothetical protein